MSDGERTLADSPGTFVTVVRDGRTVTDPRWRTGRLILSNRRIVLVDDEGKRTIPLSTVRTVQAGTDGDGAPGQASGCLSCQVGSDVTLLAPTAYDPFESVLLSALLDQRVALVKHPAVEGGVVQDADWEKGRLKLDDESLDLALATGTFVEVQVDDVGTVEETSRSIRGGERSVIGIEHAIEGTSVETHVAGPRRVVSVLGAVLGRGTDADPGDVDLETEEIEVLLALYAGVSPFEIPDFVGLDVETVESVFDRLVEAGILEGVRTRREVELKARGRSIAGEATTEQ